MLSKIDNRGLSSLYFSFLAYESLRSSIDLNRTISSSVSYTPYKGNLVTCLLLIVIGCCSSISTGSNAFSIWRKSSIIFSIPSKVVYLVNSGAETSWYSSLKVSGLIKDKICHYGVF